MERPDPSSFCFECWGSPVSRRRILSCMLACKRTAFSPTVHRAATFFPAEERCDLIGWWFAGRRGGSAVECEKDRFVRGRTGVRTIQTNFVCGLRIWMLRVYAVYVTLLSLPSRYAQPCGLVLSRTFCFQFFFRGCLHDRSPPPRWCSW